MAGAFIAGIPRTPDICVKGGESGAAFRATIKPSKAAYIYKPDTNLVSTEVAKHLAIRLLIGPEVCGAGM